MVENVEIITDQNEQEDQMQEDETSQQQYLPPIDRLMSRTSVLMFPRLDSKLCIATVLSYLIAWEDLERFLCGLNRNGKNYFSKHRE